MKQLLALVPAALLLVALLPACRNEPTESKALAAPDPVPTPAPTPDPTPETGPYGLPVHTPESGTVLADTGRALTHEHHYYDGPKRVPVWSDSEVIVELDASEAGATAVARAHPGVRLHGGSSEKGGVRFWRLSRAVDTAALCRELSSGPDALRFSPSFHATASSNTPPQALSGGVIVRFQPDWSETRISEWASTKGLTLGRSLLPTLNVFELATPPGMESLETANALHESGEVVYANPSWWMAREIRDR